MKRIRVHSRIIYPLACYVYMLIRTHGLTHAHTPPCACVPFCTSVAAHAKSYRIHCGVHIYNIYIYMERKEPVISTAPGSWMPNERRMCACLCACVRFVCLCANACVRVYRMRASARVEKDNLLHNPRTRAARVLALRDRRRTIQIKYMDMYLWRALLLWVALFVYNVYNKYIVGVCACQCDFRKWRKKTQSLYNEYMWYRVRRVDDDAVRRVWREGYRREAGSGGLDRGFWWRPTIFIFNAFTQSRHVRERVYVWPFSPRKMYTNVRTYTYMYIYVYYIVRDVCLRGP